MSGRFVRSSKYRHVHGTPAKKEKCYLGPRAETTGEGNFIAASTLYWAVALPGGGGPVGVWNHKNVGRVDVAGPKVNVHKSKVVDLDFSPFAESLLATASEDGTVKIVLLPSDGTLKTEVTAATQTLEGHQKKLSLIRWHPTANNVIGSCAYDNLVKIWDVEKGKEIASVDDHPDFPISMEWNEDGSLLATSCKDKFIRVFDPRKKGAALKGLGLEGAKGQRVVWFSGFNKVGTVGFQKSNSRGYALFDTKNMSAQVVNADLDSAAGVFIPYYDPDTSMLYLAGKGDAAIRYWEIVNEDPYVHYLSEFRDNESTKGACFLPKTMMDTTKCEVAVCYRVMKDHIAPISFQVPRKSEMFQGDIFPETNAFRPVMTAEEWAGGANKQPLKKSMKPGSAAPAGGVSSDTKFEAAAPKATTSAAGGGAASPFSGSVESQLQQALARIVELEAQLKK
jgi:coronin-1B/1C/6